MADFRPLLDDISQPVRAKHSVLQMDSRVMQTEADFLDIRVSFVA